MSEYRSEVPREPAATASSLSVPFLVLAAVLAGLGIFGLALFLVTFNWVFFASVIPLGLGAYMLFTPGTGPDRA